MAAPDWIALVCRNVILVPVECFCLSDLPQLRASNTPIEMTKNAPRHDAKCPVEWHKTAPRTRTTDVVMEG